MSRDPLAAFDDSLLAAVAGEFDVSVATLEALVRRHQRLVRRLPGVDDIVYEWRRSFPNDPVVERRTEAYYLAVAETVWPEYVAALSLSDREAELLRTVHRRQLETAVGGTIGGRAAMVLTRE